MSGCYSAAILFFMWEGGGRLFAVYILLYKCTCIYTCTILYGIRVDKIAPKHCNIVEQTIKLVSHKSQIPITIIVTDWYHK